MNEDTGVKFKILRAIAISLFMLYISRSHAEFRAYQYYVTQTLPKAQDPNAHLVVSALDPISYVAFHGGEEAIQVELLRTWICPGHTGGHKEICASPYQKVLQRLRPVETN